MTEEICYCYTPSFGLPVTQHIYDKAMTRDSEVEWIKSDLYCRLSERDEDKK